MVFPDEDYQQSDEKEVFDKIEVLHSNEVIVKKTLEAYAKIKTSLDGALDNTGPAILVLYDPIWTSLNLLKEKGIKIRGVTEVTAENIHHCKNILKVGDFRHLDGIRTNFGIIDGKQVMLHGVSQEKDPLSQAILTNVKGFVEAQQYMFDNLWNRSIPIEDKIKEIEEGIKPEVIETITNPTKIQTIYLNLLRSATAEIMLIIPTPNAINHQHGIGVFSLLEQMFEENNNNMKLNIRILTPQINNGHHDIKLKQKYKEQNTLLSFSFSSIPDINLRNIEADSTTKSTILIIDKKESLVVEIKDDTKDSFTKSVGFATYSNSRATVLSYVSIFESFWKQSELVKKLRESEELQKDFVHIAAHELKNPIQPILGLTDLLMKNKPEDEKEYQNIIKIINRNAKKLIQLTSDILDVTKIETNNLHLQKELFNLNDLISDIVEDYNNQIQKNENIKLGYDVIFSKSIEGIYGKSERLIKKETNPIYILADRTRITQVLSNLINNSIKFTSAEGIITIIVEEKYEEGKVDVTVKDSGSGIDSFIIPNLFSKFTTKSKGGTGLGLYISKNIIEAHDGKIWAQNNKDSESGATFSFNLPLAMQQQSK
jgi:two-component system, OmpR family, sensor histidine kinase VicK